MGLEHLKGLVKCDRRLGDSKLTGVLQNDFGIIEDESLIRDYARVIISIRVYIYR